jgi:hypothetical protein
MKRIPFLLACLSLALASAFAQQKTSAVGTWNVDIAHSDFSDPAPQSITVTILKDTPQMLSWRVNGVDAKGQPFTYSWSGPEDGTLHPVIEDGKPGTDMQSAKWQQDGTLLRHNENSDGSSFDARSSFSPDGNTITEAATAKSKDGKESKMHHLYRRASSSM